MTSIGVFRIVVGKLIHWGKPSPVILLVIDNNTVVGFYNTVLPFSLAISPRMEGRWKPFFDPEEVAEW